MIYYSNQKEFKMKEALINLLNEDLKNEWKHHCFYLHNASTITGLHAREYKEFLIEQSKSELDHVSQFSDLIVGLGAIPTTFVNPFPTLTDAFEILEFAMKMEEEVVENYTKRIEQAEKLGGADGRWIVIFLESQIEDSRKDLDELKQILKSKIN
jgi:bacterioferritin (cytochrome b1)